MARSPAPAPDGLSPRPSARSGAGAAGVTVLAEAPAGNGDATSPPSQDAMPPAGAAVDTAAPHRGGAAALVALLGTRRFAPLFAAQFLGAFNDNLYKQAMVILLTYGVATGGVDAAAGASTAGGGAGGGLSGATLAALAGATFIVPFVLFSALAGAIADRMDKARLLRVLKLAEFGVMVVAGVALLLASTPLMFLALALAGIQATFLGPVKFAILPAHLAQDELVSGNALVEGATFLAILTGSVLGGLVIARAGGEAVVAAGLVATGALGVVAAWLVPPAPPGPGAGRVPLDWSLFRDTAAMIRAARAQTGVWRCILSVSWFWTVGATVLSLVPAFSREALGADEHVATLILAIFSVGIGLGSIACARTLNGEVSARLASPAMAALGALLVAVAAATLLGFAPTVPAGGPLADVASFASSGRGLAVLGLLAVAAFAAGFYAVPVYTLMQTLAPEPERARVVAANNVVNALSMTLGAGVVAALSGLAGLSVPTIVGLVGAACLAVAGWNARNRPEEA